ncbi:MAG: hypothetical protein EZS28_050167, partial [Streblomastix strix]
KMKSFLMQKLKRNRVVAAAVAAVVAVAAKKYKKIGQGRETQQFRESMEMKTGWRMMNATDKWRRRDRSCLTRNNKLKPNCNSNHNSYKWKKTQKQMKTKQKGVQN